MITSTAPGTILDRLRRTSGPNPRDSKLTDTERLHLIWMFTVLIAAIKGKQAPDGMTLLDVQHMLYARGLAAGDIAAVLTEHDPANPVDLTDALAVHPSLKSITDMYLD